MAEVEHDVIDCEDAHRDIVRLMADTVQAESAEIEGGMSLKLVLMHDNDHVFDLVGYDKITATLTELKKSIASYDYSDDDRLAFKDARAAMNKMRSAIKSYVNTVKSESFATVIDKQSEIIALIDDVESALKRSLSESDERARHAKYAKLEAIFAESVTYHPALAALTLDDVLDARWLNRSASDNASIKSLSERLDMIFDAIELHLFPSDMKMRDICQRLRETDWNVTVAARQYQDELRAAEVAEEQREARIALAAKRKAEADEKAAIAARRMRVTIEVDVDDFDALISAIDATAIEYTIV